MEGDAALVEPVAVLALADEVDFLRGGCSGALEDCSFRLRNSTMLIPDAVMQMTVRKMET